MINKVILVGRLVHDPELRRTANENAVASFTIAVDGPRKDSAVFLDVTVWSSNNGGTQAENVAKYCRKGSLVGVEGRLSQRKWERKDGSKVTVTEVLADRVTFLDPKSKDGSTVSNDVVVDDTPATKVEEPVETTKNTDSIDVVDDDLPW